MKKIARLNNRRTSDFPDALERDIRALGNIDVGVLRNVVVPSELEDNFSIPLTVVTKTGLLLLETRDWEGLLRPGSEGTLCLETKGRKLVLPDPRERMLLALGYLLNHEVGVSDSGQLRVVEQAGKKLETRLGIILPDECRWSKGIDNAEHAVFFLSRSQLLGLLTSPPMDAAAGGGKVDAVPSVGLLSLLGIGLGLALPGVAGFLPSLGMRLFSGLPLANLLAGGIAALIASKHLTPETITTFAASQKKALDKEFQLPGPNPYAPSIETTRETDAFLGNAGLLENALKVVGSGKSLLLAGPHGSGKSVFLDYLRRRLVAEGHRFVSLSWASKPEIPDSLLSKPKAERLPDQRGTVILIDDADDLLSQGEYLESLRHLLDFPFPVSVLFMTTLLPPWPRDNDSACILGRTVTMRVLKPLDRQETTELVKRGFHGRKTVDRIVEFLMTRFAGHQKYSVAFLRILYSTTQGKPQHVDEKRLSLTLNRVANSSSLKRVLKALPREFLTLLLGHSWSLPEVPLEYVRYAQMLGREGSFHFDGWVLAPACPFVGAILASSNLVLRF